MNPAQLAAIELYMKRIDDIGMPSLNPQWRGAAERIRKLTSRWQEL